MVRGAVWFLIRGDDPITPAGLWIALTARWMTVCSPASRQFLSAIAVAALALTLALSEPARATAWFAIANLLVVLPVVVPGIIVAGWVSASGAGSRLASRLTGTEVVMIVAASAIGAVTPICGVTVLPLMATLLYSGIPLAPVMAFWLSSPITDPAMIGATIATLGFGFAVGKTVSAFFLGVLGGMATLCVRSRLWVVHPMRNNSVVGRLDRDDGCHNGGIKWQVWTDPERRRRFWIESWSMTRLILLCLLPAFAAEHLLHAILDPQSLTRYVGDGSPLSVPIAVLFGAPMYLEGYAALPLARGLMDHGMSAGAAMAFLISGGAVSVWGAMAIAPVLRIQPFILYLAVAVVGSMFAGWSFGLLS